MGDLVGVVLGAGSSRRLGRPKQTLAFGGRSLLAHVMRDVEASSLDRVVLVLGAMAVDVESTLDLERSELAYNHAYGAGCASSLLAGLDAVGDCDAIVMVLGDMPGVTPAVIDAVIETWRAHPTWAAVTSYDDGLGHPFVFSADSFDTLRGLHGDKAVWKIVDNEPESRVQRIAIDAPLPLDIDTAEDYARVCESFGIAAHERTPL